MFITTGIKRKEEKFTSLHHPGELLFFWSLPQRHPGGSGEHSVRKTELPDVSVLAGPKAGILRDVPQHPPPQRSPISPESLP